MDLGLVGLGKMGGNMRERIRRAGHTVVGFDRNPDVSDVDSIEFCHNLGSDELTFHSMQSTPDDES